MVEAQTSTPKYQRAVVIGASMGGLAAARALSDHFREVVLIERDALPRDVPRHRPGVPQSWHIHNLFRGGLLELEKMFPGFVETAKGLGAVHIDDMADFAGYAQYGWSERIQSELVCLSATRALLEFAERQRFYALVKNARFLESTRVMDLIVEARAGRKCVTGVITSSADEPRISADLVVDCSGRATGWKHWFKQHGIALPKETVVDSRCGYSSRFYRPRDPSEFAWRGMVVGPAFPERPHWGVIIPLQNNDWIVTLGGFEGKYPPADERGFEEFARALPAQQYWQALERAEPLTKVRAFRKLEMRWNAFEDLDGLSRFIALGDSAWAYNPLYGQGMSVAVTCARILRDVVAVDDDLDSLPRRYYPAAKRFAYPLWSSTAELDLRWPGATGPRRWYSKFLGPIGDLFVRAAVADQVVNHALLEVAHMLKTVAQALTPNVLARVVFYALKEWFVGPPKLQEVMQPPPQGTGIGPLTAIGAVACCACSERPCTCNARPAADDHEHGREERAVRAEL